MASPLIALRAVMTVPLLLLLAGCDAGFTDLRPEGLTTPPPPPDAGPRIEYDGGPGYDAGEMPMPSEELIATGTFEGRAGHGGSGTGSLVRLADGTLELRFGSDFSYSGVPGPIVLLSSRTTIGRRIDPSTDLNLGVSRADRGAQSYAVPDPNELRRIAWIFCEPFGVEVARAILADVR